MKRGGVTGQGVDIPHQFRAIAFGNISVLSSCTPHSRTPTPVPSYHTPLYRTSHSQRPQPRSSSPAHVPVSRPPQPWCCRSGFRLLHWTPRSIVPTRRLLSPRPTRCVRLNGSVQSLPPSHSATEAVVFPGHRLAAGCAQYGRCRHNDSRRTPWRRRPTELSVTACPAPDDVNSAS